MSESNSVQAFQFVFDAKLLKEVLDSNPDKVLFTVSIVEEITKDDRKVGALKITATGTKPEGEMDGLVVTGCPIPPCRQ